MVGNWKDCKIAMVLGSKLTAGGGGGASIMRTYGRDLNL
jgi:hypothetical protein